MDYTQTHEQRIDDWLVQHPKNKHGAHKYSLDQFGLSLGDINNCVN